MLLEPFFGLGNQVGFDFLEISVPMNFIRKRLFQMFVIGFEFLEPGHLSLCPSHHL